MTRPSIKARAFIRVALVATAVFLSSGTPARADTLCEDGWMSPSEGRGTCSWHGGIDHGPFGGLYPSGSDSDDGPDIPGWAILGGIGLVVVALTNRSDRS